MADQDPLTDVAPLIRRVYAYIAYRIGDGADAEDVTSATFERALRYKHTFDESRGGPAAWLIGIAGRCVSEYYANRSVSVPEIPETAMPGEFAADSALRVDLRRAVETLPYRESELIALRYGADLTARQIAGVLGMRTNAVEVALHRALQTLRGALESGDGDAGPVGRSAAE